MASSSQVPELSNEPGPSNLRIVRVKRKRNLDAPDDLGMLSFTNIKRQIRLLFCDLAAAVSI
jgi:hypothetical protein